MMKILLFTDTINNHTGGMEVHQAAFIDYFSKKADLWIITKKAGIFLYKSGVVYEKFKALRSFLRWLASNNDRDIFFFNNLSWIRQTPLLRRYALKTLFIIRSGGNDILRAPFEDDTIPLHMRQSKIVDYINTCVDHLIVNSDFSYLRNIELGISAEKMVKIRGGVDSEYISHLKAQRESLRNCFDNIYNTKNKKIVTIACRMVDFKGIPEFLDYYKKLNQERFFLLLIGDGKLGNTIRQKLCTILRDNSYAFLGDTLHEKTLEYIVISDVVINSAICSRRYFDDEFYIHTETMGRTMLEACVAGVPLIATNVGGTNELFQENIHIGSLIKSWDILSDVFMDQVSQDKVTIKNDYSWKYVFKRYMDIFSFKILKRLYVLDIDNTILKEGIEEDDIAHTLAKNKKNDILVLNTARDFSESLLCFANASNADVLIIDNGISIYCRGLKNNEWDMFVKNNLFIDELTYTCTQMQKNMPGMKMKITHPNSFVIWRDNLFSETNVVENLKSFYNPEHFQLILTSRHIKLQNRRINKKTATEFVIKNYKTCFSIGAGDAFNDIDFCLICDHAFVDSKLLEEIPTQCNISSFSHSEVGNELLARIFAIRNIENENTLI